MNPEILTKHTSKTNSWTVMLICCLTQIGCLSFTAGQTARTLKSGSTSSYMGIDSQSSKSVDEDDSDDKTANANIFFEGGGRAGIFDGFDLGVRGGTGGMTFIDGKYNFFDNGMIAMASGLGLGYAKVSQISTDSDTNAQSETTETRSEDSYTFTFTTIPFYLSFHFGKMYAFYIVPQLLYLDSVTQSKDKRTTTGGTSTTVGSSDRDTSTESKSSNRYFGLSLGGIIGSPIGFLFEYSTHFGLDKDNKKDSGQQIVLGASFGHAI